MKLEKVNEYYSITRIIRAIVTIFYRFSMEATPQPSTPVPSNRSTEMTPMRTIQRSDDGSVTTHDSRELSPSAYSYIQTTFSAIAYISSGIFIGVMTQVVTVISLEVYSGVGVIKAALVTDHSAKHRLNGSTRASGIVC